MFDFSSFLNLPLIFISLLAFVIFLYVLLDGFDLGVGIIFPFAPSDQCRNKMMNSIVPFWDGNETWLVFGGMGLFASFPAAYSIIMPAFYMPIIIMLLGLIFRGVAFEFRFKAESVFEQKIWDYSFHFGSLIAAFAQGLMLGCFIEGFHCDDQGCSVIFSAFSCMVGVAVVFGYALLGSTWLVMKTHGVTQKWARSVGCYCTVFVALFVALFSLWTPFLNENIRQRWFLNDNIFYLMPIPLITLAVFYFLIRSLVNKNEKRPFVLTILLFILGYVGIAVSLFPYIIPYYGPFFSLAATPQSLSFLLVAIVIILPVILGYTFYSYYVFRGKSSHEKMY